MNLGKMAKAENQARKLRKELKGRKIQGNSRNGLLTLHMNAAGDFEDIEIDESLLSPDMISVFKNSLGEAFKDYRKRSEKEAMKNMDMDQLKELFN